MSEQSGIGHTCLLLSTGAVQCLGHNWRGQLGNGTVAVANWAPHRVAGLSRVRALAVGDGHNCVLLADTTVRCWGKNTSGQLGDGTLENRPRPVVVDGLRGVKALAASNAATCALRLSGDVWCWGSISSFGPEVLPDAQRRPRRLIRLSRSQRARTTTARYAATGRCGAPART